MRGSSPDLEEGQRRLRRLCQRIKGSPRKGTEMTEHKTGLEDSFVLKGHKKLRCGYTTGSCAAAAAKAAAVMLLRGAPVEEIALETPKGILLHLLIEEIEMKPGTGPYPERVRCAVRKDGGDDPDATHGLLVYAEVSRRQEQGIFIDGGEGRGPGNQARPESAGGQCGPSTVRPGK